MSSVTLTPYAPLPTSVLLVVYNRDESAAAIFAAGQGSTGYFTQETETTTFFGQVDINLTDRLSAILGASYIEDNKIADFGTMSKAPKNIDNTIDLTEQFVLPCWCDPHSHLIFAASREGEFVDRINGLSYEEIANNGGGILNSAKKLQNTSEDKLYQQAKQRLRNKPDLVCAPHVETFT